MIKPRPTSVVVLITLAELAWLAALGLLLAYRGKVGDLGNVRRELNTATNRLAQWEAKARDASKLFDQLEVAKGEIQKLQDGLRAFEKLLRGKPPEEAARILAEAERTEKKLVEIENEAKALKLTLQDKEQAAMRVSDEMRSAANELARLREQIAGLPPNAAELANQFRQATNRVNQLEAKLQNADTNIAGLTSLIGKLQIGEVAIRRELTGLPSSELRRVIFVVDTSSSMRDSPAWDAARRLMRTWLEHLSVQECVLVNFNDAAVAFPGEGYLRVRDDAGTADPAKREELLAAFDKARPGVFSDLLKGLKLAYGFPRADLIVLFTDGHPHVATRRDSAYAADILKEVAKHPEIPVLAVAVGSYEIEGAGGPAERANAAILFLKRLAGQTGGSFIGR